MSIHSKLRCTSFAMMVTCMFSITAGAKALPAVVVTEQGSLSGNSDGSISSFLGVPFAAPPVGARRWQSPAPPAHWTGVRGATAFANSCYQPDPPPLFGPYTEEFMAGPAPSEDCLYLNVWAPADTSRKHPVMVWLHGGGFLGGSGAVEIYNGANLAKKGVVVVTVNYRVGPFGYLAHPELSRENPHGVSGNYGLMDQIAALEWVARNIDRFGGDPANVTLAGQSAGAISVADLLVSPSAKSLFHKAILQSAVTMGKPTPTQSEAQTMGRTFVDYLGATSAQQLRDMPADKIQAAVWLPIKASEGMPRVVFQPNVDGYLVAQDPMLPRSAPFLDLPVITGFTADERLGPPTTTASQFVANVRQRFGGQADMVLSLYPHSSDAQASASAKTLASDGYQAALAQWADGQQSGGNRVYTYIFEHSPPVATPPSFGAFHTAEVPYVFGVLDTHRRPYDGQDRKLSEQIQHFWIDFMKTGNPTPGAGSAWAPYTEGHKAALALNGEAAMQPLVSTPERAAFLKAFGQQGGVLIP